MQINHNITAMNTLRQLNINSNNQAKSMQKLSSGLRINSAADDAAGLSISEKMKGQIRGLDQASRNAQDGISMISTAEGALSETTDILQRMRELATQASNDTYTSQDRDNIQKEMNQLTSEVNRIGNTTEFNTKKLLDGSVSDQAGIVKVTTNSFAANGTGIDGSSIVLDSKSSLTAGNYHVQVQDVTAKTGNVTGLDNTKGFGGSGVTVATDASIGNGNYAVQLDKTTSVVGNTSGSTLDTSETGVSSFSVGNTSLSAGNYTMDITRTDAVGNTSTGTSGGVTAVDIDPQSKLDAGTYNVTVTKKQEGTIGDAAGAAGGDSNAITSLTVDSNANDLVNGNLEVKYTNNAGQWSATLYNKTNGTAISDAVVLDNNQQDYSFHGIGNGASLGVSFTTASDVNTVLTNNSSDVNSAQDFSVGSTLTLTDSNNQVLGTADVLSSDNGTTPTQISLANGQHVNITQSGNDSLTNGTATFTVTNTLGYNFDNGAATGTFTAGSSISLSNGLTFATSSNIDDYTDGSSATIALQNQDVVQASLINTDTNQQENGTAKIQVQAGQTYNFGNGVSFTTNDSDMNIASSQQATFTVGSTTQTNAILKNGAASVETLNNISANSTLNFQNGDLKVNVGSLTNGIADFNIEGGVQDQSLTFQVGANSGQTFSVNIHDMRSEALGISGSTADGQVQVQDSQGKSFTAVFRHDKEVTNGTDNTNQEYALDLSTSKNADAAITVLDNAINNVSSERAKLGAYSNRLDHTINNLNTSSQNITDAESRITDVDMAKEMMNQTKSSVLAQAAQAMLAQANQQPQQVLQLLR